MQVIVITDEVLKNEFLMQSHADELQLHFIPHPDEYPQDSSSSVCIDLLFDGSQARAGQLKDLSCSLTIVNAVITTNSWLEAGFIRINGWPGFLRRPVIEASVTGSMNREQAAEFFNLLGRRVEWVPDLSGFISARVVATIVNEAFFALEEGISTAAEIDIAMKSGTNYPFGPFEWAEMIGLRNIYTLLRELAVEESRYTPCKLLEKKALA